MKCPEEEIFAIRLMQFDARPRVSAPVKYTTNLPEFNVLMGMSFVICSFLLSCVVILYFHKFFLHSDSKATTTAMPQVLASQAPGLKIVLPPAVHISIPQPSSELSLTCLNGKLEFFTKKLQQLIDNKFDYYTLAEKTLDIVNGRDTHVNSFSVEKSLSYLLILGKNLCQMRGNIEQKFRARDVSSKIANQLRVIKYILEKNKQDFREYHYTSIQDAHIAISMTCQSIREYKRDKDLQLRQKIKNSFESFAREFELPKKYPPAELVR